MISVSTSAFQSEVELHSINIDFFEFETLIKMLELLQIFFFFNGTLK